MYFNCLLFEYLLALPVYLIIAIAYLYYLIGTWSFLAIAVFLVGYLIQVSIQLFDISKAVPIVHRNNNFYTYKKFLRSKELTSCFEFLICRTLSLVEYIPLLLGKTEPHKQVL